MNTLNEYHQFVVIEVQQLKDAVFVAIVFALEQSLAPILFFALLLKFFVDDLLYGFTLIDLALFLQILPQGVGD